MTTEHAYSTSSPAALAAYRDVVAARDEFGPRVVADVEALGAGPGIYTHGGAIGPEEITSLEQKGDHVPDGWRVVRGRLVPRRGRPGEVARQWLADHQVPDVRHVMTGYGLPRATWVPSGDGLRYRIVGPRLFEHEGTLWACYEGEPGTSQSGFDRERCTWTPRKLSEFYTALEAVQARDGRPGGSS
jgi:hypothetical protein